MSGLFGKDRICGVVAAETAKEMRLRAREALGKTHTLELRLDYLRSSEELSAFLAWLGGEKPRGVLIATCRREEGGGRFKDSRKEQIEILARAVRSGCRWCDVEIETAKHFAKGELERLLRPARVMISHHDFRRTPRDLTGVFRRLRNTGAPAIKIAAQCTSVTDSAGICELASRRRNVVAIPMGEFGLAGRVLSFRAGTALAYASVDQSTAPGQLSLDAMIDLYRAGQITRRTRVYGVIGDPIGHSLSPLLYNTAFRARKVDAVFVPFLARELRDFFKATSFFGVAGIAVTIPHKEAILKYLDDCDPLAARIGAVNTVVVRGGGQFYGYNTDYVGVLRSLESRLRLRGSRILLFGAGGAARAAAFALAQAGSIVCLSSRRPEQAQELARAVGGQALPRGDLSREYFDVIVNCTPVGMHGANRAPAVQIGRWRLASNGSDGRGASQAEGSQGTLPLTSDELNCRIIMDMVYRPRETELLRLARRKGMETISGVEMFLAQGFAQYEIWTGERAPENAMRKAILAALEQEEKSGEHVQPKVASEKNDPA